MVSVDFMGRAGQPTSANPNLVMSTDVSDRENNRHCWSLHVGVRALREGRKTYLISEGNVYNVLLTETQLTLLCFSQ